MTMTFLERLGEKPSQQLNNNNNTQGPKLPVVTSERPPPDTIHTEAAPADLDSLLLPGGWKTAKHSLPVSSVGGNFPVGRAGALTHIPNDSLAGKVTRCVTVTAVPHQVLNSCSGRAQSPNPVNAPFTRKTRRNLFDLHRWNNEPGPGSSP